MMTQLLILITALSVSSSLAADSGCVNQSISLDDKLALNGKANDHNSDGLVTGADVTYDLTNNYDTNGDGVVDEAEWIARWTCAFGDTDYMARYAFNMIGQGLATMNTTGYTDPPFDTGVPVAQFIAINKQRYTLFRQQRCVNTYLTVDQKLALNLEQNNYNNDSVVDSSDIYYDLSNRYDTNNDTKVTAAEGILHWCCVYGDTNAYARYVWEEVSHGADFIHTDDFSGPPFDHGLPLAAFMDSNRKRYETYAAQQGAPIGK